MRFVVLGLMACFVFALLGLMYAFVYLEKRYISLNYYEDYYYYDYYNYNNHNNYYYDYYDYYIIQFICIAQFHKLQICLGVLYNLYT